MKTRAAKGSARNKATEAPSRDRSDVSSAHHKQNGKATKTKTFVLDTNVLLHNPRAIFVFQEHDVVIPFTVLEELDTFKTRNDDVGRNARECIRHLDALREKGRLLDGVCLGNGEPALEAARGAGCKGMLRVDVSVHERPEVIREDTPDNRILASALSVEKDAGRVVFVSKDLNARLKADALGLIAEDFETDKVEAEHLYTGYTTAEVHGALIDELYDERMLDADRLAEAIADDDEPRDFAPNEFVLMIDSDDEGHTGLARRLADTEQVIPVTGPRKPVFGIMARNVQQTMALDLLLDDDVRLVTLIGQAGTGKTLLAVAAGMAKTFNEERYEKMLVARPIMPMGRDIGYLPGDKDEKLTAWMQPIFDNLAYLLSTRGAHNQLPESHSTEQRINKLIADGRLVLEPLTYIRGRSIPHQFIIVDEAQNLTPHEVKTIVSRVGDGTKIVLTGDVAQIDNPYLDASSNGLSYAVERMKGLGQVGHVTLSKSERSALASLAAERL